ncbi:MAG: hypothetical protein ACUVRG_07245 [Ignavibacterium sp.]|uniref:hypothetical protein n=1 Tax=Ignavibacterium sp. TaxID=2651167 RepID=UPI00404A73F5
MKSKISIIFFVIILFGLNSLQSIAQTDLVNDSRIWSKIQIDRKAPTIINESDYRWIPVDPKFQTF